MADFDIGLSRSSSTHLEPDVGLACLSPFGEQFDEYSSSGSSHEPTGKAPSRWMDVLLAVGSD